MSVWLDADIDILVARVSRRSHRPLLVGKDRADGPDRACGKSAIRSMPKPISTSEATRRRMREPSKDYESACESCSHHRRTGRPAL